MSRIKPLSYEGHTWIKVVGDAYTPARFWGRTLLTDQEYCALADKSDYRPLAQQDIEWARQSKQFH